MSLRDVIPSRDDGSTPRDLHLRPGQSIQVCCLDLGATKPAVAREALREAVERGLLNGFRILPKRALEGDEGPTGHFALIVAQTPRLLRFNQRYRLGELRRWHGGRPALWPDWAKTTEGKPLHRYLGVNNSEDIE